MKQYIICLIALLVSSSVFSQQTKTSKPIALELSIGYEKNGFNGNYQKHYFWEDGNFSILDKNASKTSLGIKTLLNLNKRNALFLGLGYTIFIGNANNEKIVNSFVDFELGHRLYTMSISSFDIYIDNSLNFENNRELRNHHLKGINLIWKPGLHIEKSISEKLNLVMDINYGLGLNNSSVGNRYFLRTNSVGCNIGIRKQL